MNMKSVFKKSIIIFKHSLHIAFGLFFFVTTLALKMHKAVIGNCVKYLNNKKICIFIILIFSIVIIYLLWKNNNTIDIILENNEKIEPLNIEEETLNEKIKKLDIEEQQTLNEDINIFKKNLEKLKKEIEVRQSLKGYNMFIFSYLRTKINELFKK